MMHIIMHRLVIELRETHCDGVSNQFNHVYSVLSMIFGIAAQERARPTFSFFTLRNVV